MRTHVIARAGAPRLALVAVAAAALLAALVAPATGARAADDDLTLVWSDEFSGPTGAPPDASRWTVETGTGYNNELQYYTPNENAGLDGDGHLVIEARKEPRGGMQYTSGRVNSSGHFSFQYGRVEARIKVPEGRGYWPAFWMLGNNYLTGTQWPASGEIDMMEVLGRNTREAYSTIHGPGYSGGNGVGQKYTALDGAKLSDDFHTWAADWDATGIRFSMDGRVVFTASRAAIENIRGPWVFDQPFYVILNLAVGGDFPGNPDATTPFPAQMLVDYVRVYQDVPPTTPGPGDVTVTARIPLPDGEFAWSIDPAGREVTLSDAANAGPYLESTGSLGPVDVTDTREGGPQWSVSGQVSDFSDGLPGSYLGWAPSVTVPGAGATAGGVVASGVDGGAGLSASSVLASAPAGHAPGSTRLGADLDLRIPVDTAPGTYAATLTLTALG